MFLSGTVCTQREKEQFKPLIKLRLKGWQLWTGKIIYFYQASQTSSHKYYKQLSIFFFKEKLILSSTLCTDTLKAIMWHNEGALKGTSEAACLMPLTYKWENSLRKVRALLKVAQVTVLLRDNLPPDTLAEAMFCFVFFNSYILVCFLFLCYLSYAHSSRYFTKKYSVIIFAKSKIPFPPGFHIHF